MAYENITHSCGHEQRVQMYGPHRERDRKAAWMAKEVCPACEDAAKVARAANQAAECTAAGLPELTGTPKQITWALDIRAGYQSELQAHLAKLRTCTPLPGKEAGFARVVEWMSAGIAELLSNPSASHWIERRSEISEEMWTNLARRAQTHAKQEGWV